MKNTNLLRIRSTKGHSLSELAPMLFIIFVLFLVPLICFGTMGLRYVFLSYAARLASSAGARCLSFQTDVNPPSQRSAVNTAGAVAVQCINSFSNMSLTNITCSIVSNPLVGGTPTRQTTPLTAPANTVLNTYDFEVTLQAQIKPLIPDTSAMFGGIPGLSAPINTSVRSDTFFENTQGLTQ